MNFVNAFTYLFKQKNWFVKSLIGSLLFFFIKIIAFAFEIIHAELEPQQSLDLLIKNSVMPSVSIILLQLGALVLILFSVWMLASVYGYFVTTIRRFMRGQEDAVPDWDEVMSKLFCRGLKAFLALFLFMSLLLVLWIASHVLALAWGTVSPFASMLSNVVISIAVIYSLLLLPALMMSFCEKDKFFAAFDLIRAKQLAMKSIGNYIVMLLMLGFVAFLGAVTTLLLFEAKIGILLLPVICFYLVTVFGNIVGQYYVTYCKE